MLLKHLFIFSYRKYEILARKDLTAFKNDFCKDPQFNQSWFAPFLSCVLNASMRKFRNVNVKGAGESLQSIIKEEGSQDDEEFLQEIFCPEENSTKPNSVSKLIKRP